MAWSIDLLRLFGGDVFDEVMRFWTSFGQPIGPRTLGPSTSLNFNRKRSFFKLLDNGGDGSVDLEDFFDGALGDKVGQKKTPVLHPRKLTWQWNIHHLKMYFPLKMDTLFRRSFDPSETHLYRGYIIWHNPSKQIQVIEKLEPRKNKNSCFSFYWLLNRDLYNGAL